MGNSGFEEKFLHHFDAGVRIRELYTRFLIPTTMGALAVVTAIAVLRREQALGMMMATISKPLDSSPRSASVSTLVRRNAYIIDEREMQGVQAVDNIG